jgi:hypothetical protein
MERVLSTQDREYWELHLCACGCSCRGTRNHPWDTCHVLSKGCNVQALVVKNKPSGLPLTIPALDDPSPASSGLSDTPTDNPCLLAPTASTETEPPLPDVELVALPPAGGKAPSAVAPADADAGTDASSAADVDVDASLIAFADAEAGPDLDSATDVEAQPSVSSLAGFEAVTESSVEQDTIADPAS